MLNWLRKLVRIFSEETQGFHAESAFLWSERGAPGSDNDSSERLRRAGFSVAPGALVEGLPRLTGKRPLSAQLVIGANARLGFGAVLDLEDSINIEQDAVLGAFVTILTSTHELGPREHRAGTVTRAPVHIGAGALVGPRSLILPGVTIGAGAEVRAGSVVNRDVAPQSIVEGVPAVVVSASRL